MIGTIIALNCTTVKLFRDKCEENPKASYLANVEIPMYLARASKERKLICFSSDQVYSGCEEIGPYLEEKAKPANTYAKHKLEMEQRVLDIQPSAVMLRAEWMYDMDAKKYGVEFSDVSMGLIRCAKDYGIIK